MRGSGRGGWAFAHGFVYAPVGSTANEADDLVVVVDMALRRIRCRVHLHQRWPFCFFCASLSLR